MDYASSWPPPPQQLPHKQHPYTAPPPQHHLNVLPYPHPQPPPPPSYSSPYYPNPSPNPNPNPSPLPNYSFPPPPAPAAPETYPPNPYTPHGGYAAGPAADVGGSGGLAAYYYERVAHAQELPVPAKSKAKKAPKTNKVVQSAFCGVCKIDCNSQEVLNSHKQGKKHKKNLQKLQESITPKPPKAPVTPKPVTPTSDKGKGVGSEHNRRKAVPDEEDLETKKRKVLDGGAEPTGVKVCTVCNIVVNSQKVFESHIFGQKHAANVKKLQQAPSAAS